MKIPLSSPHQYWKMASTKTGPIINAINNLKDTQKIDDRRDLFKGILLPYLLDNTLNLDCLITGQP